MSELYLIAHLVRGQPAFDIATLADDMGTAEDPGPWWIIPTSGHRAYPFGDAYSLDLLLSQVGLQMPTVPEGHPDHYSVNAAPKGQGLVSNLAERLGLVKRPVVNRR